MNIEEKIINKSFLNPYSLRTTNERKVIDKLLPFSIGIEFECTTKDTYDIDFFKNIKNILDIRVDKEEQRYRIPKGYTGACCLYDLSLLLIEHSIENSQSGIHYHVDSTTFFDEINLNIIKSTINTVLEELDTWNYKGSFNTRDIGDGHKWVRTNVRYKTLEYRIGEMTFDYSLLMKRISHISYLTALIENAVIYPNNIVQVDMKKITNLIANRTIKL